MPPVIQVELIEIAEKTNVPQISKKIEEQKEPDEKKKEEILKKVPLRRMGSVEDIVMMVDYLVTKNSYMTGRNINVDGGKSLG